MLNFIKKNPHYIAIGFTIIFAIFLLIMILSSNNNNNNNKKVDNYKEGKESKENFIVQDLPHVQSFYEELDKLGDMKCPLDDNHNINDLLQQEYLKYKSQVWKYRLGSKSYEYDFIPFEQPIQGLKPDYKQDYPSTLKKENRMFTIPNMAVDYSNLMNTQNTYLAGRYNI